MAQNFLTCDREQTLLLPPSLRDWLAEDHLAWFVLDAVDELDLAAFYGEYREDGWGRAAFDPALMVALLVYAYAIGERSSRAIERRCREDIAFRVIAVDGTKMHANASMSANRSYEKITEEILAEAAAADAEDDAQLGDLRGDELPAHLVGRSSRKARLKAAKERLESEVKLAQQAHRERVKERAALERERGSKLRGRKPNAPARRVDPAARANLTDPDSRLMRGPKGFLQGYNAQAATSASQIILAAELSTDSPDGRLLEPMVEAARDRAARGRDR